LFPFVLVFEKRRSESAFDNPGLRTPAAAASAARGFEEGF